MATEIDPRDVALAFIKALVADLTAHAAAATAFNHLPNIPWHIRQRVRTVEGKLNAVEEECIELVASLGTAEANAYLKEMAL